MWVWIDRVGLILFDATLSTTVFLSLVVLALLVCRQPTRRLLIARVALVAALAMIPLVALAPLPRFDLMRAVVAADLIPTFPRPKLDRDDPLPAARAGGEPAPSSRAHFPSDLRSVGSYVARGLTLLDLAGIGTGFAWLLLGFAGARWLIRSAQQPTVQTIELYERLLSEAGDARLRPVLLVSARVHHPVVLGWWSPTILIPPSLEGVNRDPEYLRLSILHEMAHVEQSDHRYGMVASVAQTIWFFLPQMWWLRSRLLIDQEFLADRAAARRYGTSSGYAASLLALAQSRSASTAASRPPAAELSWTGGARTDVPSPLFQRVLMLLHCPFRVEMRLRRTWSWASRFAVIAVSILSACLLFRWPDSEAFRRAGRWGTASRPYTFRVTDFVAEPLIFSPGSRALPYVLPVVLPSQFDLTVEVLSSLADLAHVRLAGHPLGPMETAGAGSGPERDSLTLAAKSWHQVRLERDGQNLRLWVDGRSIPVALSPEAMTEWLTIEPGPGTATQFRNLVLAW
jgi:beta-lactamase regulating signal transducer with metallopeptidase domain